MRVFVYKNVRRQNFSVRAMEGPDRGRVILHVEAVEVLEAEFRVSEAGRQRVLRTGQKNVHAGVVGILGKTKGAFPANGSLLAKYDPFKGPAFTSTSGRVLRRARAVVLVLGNAWALDPE